jgi:hypothetical protein
MEYGSGRVVTSTRGLGLAVLAVSALFARVPWGDVGLPLGALPGVGLSPEWVVAAGPFLGWVGIGLESLLVWLLVYLALPELYPERARALTSAVPYRVGVASLTTAAASLVVLGVSGTVPPAAFGGLVVAALVVTVATTSWTNNWEFTTPYVSPTFAVLSSFVPTDRLPDVAALFQTARADPRTRVSFQALFGLLTAGFVLVTGTLAALPALAFPALELLVLGWLGVVAGRRLFTLLPPSWRLRWRQSTRRVERAVWLVRSLLTSLRGMAATLLVTSGFLLGVSVTVLAVAVAASAVRRAASFGATLSLSPSGVLTEWFVVVALLVYAATVGRFWARAARWLPSFVAPRPRGKTPRLDGGLDRPPGVLVPQALALVAAMFVLYPHSAPGSDPLPVLAIVATAALTALSVAPRRILETTPFDRAAARLPRVPDHLALPTAFVVQWLGTSVALVVLPGTGLASVAPTTAFVLVVALGGYFAAAARARLARHRPSDVNLAYLVVLTAAAALLVWVTEQSIRVVLFG